MIDKMIRCKKLDVTDRIDCLSGWFEKCPPLGKMTHWKDGRSAKETAKHWLHTIPSQFIEILSPFKLNYKICSPEFVSKLDGYGGNSRNHDLLIIAENTENEAVLITIESKADEKFDDTISISLRNAQRVLDEKPGSNQLKRREDLRLAIFGDLSCDQLPLRFQLLTGVAGTLSEAKSQKASKAIFILQTFVSDETKKKDHQRNQDDLDSFVHYLTKGKTQKIEEGQLVGPIRVPGNKFIPNSIDLWIGKYEIKI